MSNLIDGYRMTADGLREPVAALVDADRDLVLFDAGCPWCGSHKLLDVAPWGRSQVHYRWFVPARTWSFLWWGPRIAHFKCRCAGCGAKFRELPKELT